MGGVVFHIGPAGGAVEHVIGREMNQPRIHLAAGQSQIPHRQPIYRECRLRLLFRHIHLVVCRGVEDYLRVIPRKRTFHRRAIRDIHLSAVQSQHGVLPRLEFPDQLNTELAAGPKYHRASAHKNFTG